MTKWNINLTKGRTSDLPAPFGYCRDHSIENKNQSDSAHKTLVEKKLMEIATANKGQIFMNMFMMWMIGNSIHIVTLFLIFRGLSSAFSAILDVNKVFKDYEGTGESLVKYKLIYLAINIFLLGLVVNKLMNIGLLPVSPSDWIDLIPPFKQSQAITSAVL